MLRIRVAVVAVWIGLAAWPAAAHGAVGFIDKAPVALPRGPYATARVELFNGSPRPQDLTLRVLQAPAEEIVVTSLRKADKRSATAAGVAAGATAVFVLTLAKPPTAAPTDELLATSTDGTSARLGLQIGDAAPPAEALPKDLDLGTATAGDPVVVTVKGLPAVTTPEPVGTLYSSRRDSATVQVEPDEQLRVDGLGDSGTYKGDVDLNGAQAGGASSLKVDVRDGIALPLIVLLLGIGVGFGIEWWLSRLRPRSLLDRRLGRLFDRANQRRDRVDKALKRRFIKSRPASMAEPEDNVVWRVPQVAATLEDGVERCYLTRAGKELADGLRNARTDSERALFGPDGDKYKALLGDEDIYAELVGDLLEAAHIADRDFKDLRCTGDVPLRSWFDFECNGWILGDKPMLEAHRDSAKALRKAAEQFADYRRRLRRAEALAGQNIALKATLEARRKLLDHTFAGDAGQVTWWDAQLSALELQLVETPTEDPADPVALTDDAEPPEPLDAHPPPPRPPGSWEPPPTPDPPWDRTPWTLRGSLQFVEVTIGFVTLVLVTGSGISAVYFANSTFGTTGDYLTIALWGSTATAGIALVRRLLPGALTTGT